MEVGNLTRCLVSMPTYCQPVDVILDIGSLSFFVQLQIDSAIRHEHKIMDQYSVSQHTK